MNKIKLEPGKKYAGYAILNEFGEINFTPSQVGSRPEQQKIVVEREEYTLYETKNFNIVKFKVKKTLGFRDKLSWVLKIADLLIEDFRKYDF